jgi:4-hydroxymandelate oxidase
MTSGVKSLLSIGDVERRCHGLLPRDVWDFIAGGSGTESALAANAAAMSRVQLLPRVLRDVSRCTTRSELFGTTVAMPAAVAPMAYQRLVHPDGELAAAGAAKDAGIPFIAAALSSYSVEHIAKAAGPLWFQLYWLRDRDLMFDLVRRAEDAGCEALMLTVDVPWMGRRLRDLRNQFALPGNITAHEHASGGSAVAAHTSAAFDPSLSWSDLEILRSRTRLPLIVKGVLHPDDAARLVESGVDGLVVSNHGGRQLDVAVPGIQVLPMVRRAVGEGYPIFLDGGVRSGTDVLKALALGATGVLIGRPVLWGLAVAGEAGAHHVLRLVADELADALGLAGCRSVSEARELAVFQNT